MELNIVAKILAMAFKTSIPYYSGYNFNNGFLYRGFSQAQSACENFRKKMIYNQYLLYNNYNESK